MEIRGEQADLVNERDALAKILSSEGRLRRKVREELAADAEEFGDVRRSPIIERGAARAMDETALIPTEPVTVVLSEKGWIRAGKGHDLDPKELSYKAGDGFFMAAKGRTNQSAVVLDSTGRTYSLAAHGLPSARGQGEPLSSHTTPPPGATFVGVMIGGDDDLYLMATSAGYGFIVKLGDLQTRQRAGKAVITVPDGAKVLTPIRITDPETELLTAASDAGRLLVFPVKDLPLLPRGKGVKILSFSAKEPAALAACAVFREGAHLLVHSGKRYLNLKPSEWKEFAGNRALKGNKLPRGYQNVGMLEVAGKET
jgi:topoisomerase-4 subunit A